jgi:alpha-tubulin suppressor-like RCC1 family protein
MRLSTYSKSIVLALSMSLGACSYFLPSTTPSAFGLLADRGDTRPFEKPLPINTQPKRLALGTDFAIGVKEDGTVWSWGDNKKGQLGYKEDGVPYGDPANLQYDPQQLTPKQIPDLKEVVSIGAVSTYSYALSKQGYVYKWGKEKFNNESIALTTPTKIYKNSDAVKIIATLEGVVVLKKTGKIDLLFQPREFLLPLVSNTRTFLEQGIEVKAFELQLPLPVVSMGSSSAYYFLLNDGLVYAIGNNDEGQLGQGNLWKYDKLVKVKNIGRIVQIAENDSVALDEQGRIWLWGGNIYWRPDLGVANSNKEPYPIRIKTQLPIDFIATNRAIAMGFRDSSLYFMQEDNGNRGTGKPPRSPQTTSLLMTPEKSLWTWK